MPATPMIQTVTKISDGKSDAGAAETVSTAVAVWSGGNTRVIWRAGASQARKAKNGRSHNA